MIGDLITYALGAAFGFAAGAGWGHARAWRHRLAAGAGPSSPIAVPTHLLLAEPEGDEQRAPQACTREPPPGPRPPPPEPLVRMIMGGRVAGQRMVGGSPRVVIALDIVDGPAVMWEIEPQGDKLRAYPVGTEVRVAIEPVAADSREPLPAPRPTERLP
jgi:hypothetical protein